MSGKGFASAEARGGGWGGRRPPGPGPATSFKLYY